MKHANVKKSLAVLVPLFAFCAALVIGAGFLLHVSEEERLARAITEVYGEAIALREEIALTPEQARNAYGEIQACYLLSDGNYLFQSTGVGGFKNGTVTLWTALECEGAHKDGTLRWSGVKKVVFESSVKQSYIDKTAAMYKTFTMHNRQIVNGALFSTEATGSDILNLATGATMSSAATCNAVNATLVCFQEVFLGVQNDYLYQNYIDLAASSATVSGDTVSYALAVKGNSPARTFAINIRVTDGAITFYEIVQNGSTSEKYLNNMPDSIKDGSLFLGKNASEITALLNETGALAEASGLLSTGATRSVESCVRAAAFAVCNYEAITERGGLQ